MADLSTSDQLKSIQAQWSLARCNCPSKDRLSHPMLAIYIRILQKQKQKKIIKKARQHSTEPHETSETFSSWYFTVCRQLDKKDHNVRGQELQVGSQKTDLQFQVHILIICM